MARDFSWAELDSWEVVPPEVGKPLDADSVLSIEGAQAKIETLLDRLASEGFDISGWDDGTITLNSDLGSATIMPRRALNKR
jgi:hypothetical protein